MQSATLLKSCSRKTLVQHEQHESYRTQSQGIGEGISGLLDIRMLLGENLAILQ